MLSQNEIDQPGWCSTSSSAARKAGLASGFSVAVPILTS
jgi:hypothetical protein